jgi:hypothetical protein
MILIALMMEAVNTSETSINFYYQTTRRKVPKTVICRQLSSPQDILLMRSYRQGQMEA